jgi:phosphoribosylformylglycinamidine cyclo-ligase
VSDSYASAGVDTGAAERAVEGLVAVLRTIDPGRPSLAALGSGHYANVLEIAPGLGIALSTDGVGSKLILAEQLRRFDTVGIDCIAMNVNDVICVGAEPLAVLDYIAVERADPEILREIALGLKAGAELAGVEIPGGELAQLPELVRGHPSPLGFDLVGACFGTVAIDQIVTGAACSAGDVVIGLPSSGLHSNGYTLARRALLEGGGLTLEDRPEELAGRSVGDALLEPTVIYVRAVLELLRDSAIDVHGLAHITSGGLLNLLRLEADVGFEIDTPLPPGPLVELIAQLGGVGQTELLEVFNCGCGFCVVVPAAHVSPALALLEHRHPGATVIGRVTDRAGQVSLPGHGLIGTGDGGFQAA